MIIRRHITANYTIIPNEAILDGRLSIAARWLLIYLLSRPHNWQVQVSDIQKQGNIGRDKAYALVKELVGARWVRRDESRLTDGKWGGVEYVVMDEPEATETQCIDSLSAPLPEKPDTVNPLPVKPHLNKNGKTPRTEKKTNISADAEFDEFWAAYPKRPNNPKAPAKAKYLNARTRLNVSHETLLQAAKAYATTREGEDPKFTAQAVTWLNQRRWEDEQSAASVPAVAVEDGAVEQLQAEAKMRVGDRAACDQALAGALAAGATMAQLMEAAKKFRLLVKQKREGGYDMPVPLLETWLKFRWRDMDAYELCTSGMLNRPAVRPKRERAA